MALDLFAARHPEVDIHVFGEPVKGLPFRAIDHGVLAPAGLDDLYNRCIAGLVLSATNVSLVPHEMLPSGCLPVVNDAEHNRIVLDNPRGRLRPADAVRAGQRAERGGGARSGAAGARRGARRRECPGPVLGRGRCRRRSGRPPGGARRRPTGRGAGGVKLRSRRPVRREAGMSVRRRLVLRTALCGLIALVAAAANAKGTDSVAGAGTQAGVELPRADVVQANTNLSQIQALSARTLLLGELLRTPPLVAEIAHQAGIPTTQLSVATSYLQNVPEQMLGPDLEVRGVQIIKLRATYQLDIEPDPNLPRMQIYARGPSVVSAEALANAVVPALQAYLRQDAISHHADPDDQVRIEQLGAPRGALIGSKAKYEIAGLTFLIALGLAGAVLMLITRARAGWRLAAYRARFGEPERPARAPSRPRTLVFRRRDHGGPPARRETSAARRRRRRLAARVADDWPHTTRILPWMVAAFLVVIWILPFDSIQLGGSGMPIDLKFDRIILPFVFLVWVLAMAAGRRAAPRLKMTWLHAGILGFVALACLTFALNAHYLVATLQLSRGMKQLTLLCAYAVFFVIVASSIKRSEVPAFLRFTLILAVIAGIGTIVEYRFAYNVFYDLSHKLLPGFQVGAAQSAGVDNLGRRLVEGPAEVPLEAVGMFTLALPIALVGLVDTKRWWPRVGYGLAAAILLAAAVSTERKSGLLGPLGVIVTLAFFRRRQMVRLLPLAVVLLGLVKVLIPGALGGTAGQLAPSALGVNTVSERVVRWDAIRPDVWLHLAVGQGFGVYSVRVLDNEYLDRLIEGGVLGLAAYILMFLTIVFVAVGPIRRREPLAATAGIVAAAAAVGTLVLSATYDSMGFPHVPYILFSLAGFLAVVLRDERVPLPGRSRAPAARRHSTPASPPTPALPEVEWAWRS